MMEETGNRASDRQPLDAAFFARLLGSVNDLVWCVALDLSKLLYINPAAAKIYGRPLEEIFASERLWIDAVHPEDRAKLEENLQGLGDFSVEQQFRIVQPSGHIRWLEGRFGRIQGDSDEPFFGIGGIAKDVTKRWTTERALEEATSVYSSLVESLPINVFRKDVDGRIRFGNQRYCESLGQPLDNLLGKTDFDLFSNELAEKYTQDDARVLSTGEAFQDVEQHQTPQGEVIFVEVLKAPVRDVNNQIVGIQGMFWDVTERKRAEHALREAKELAEAASKAKSDFLANMSHEIRTPMNAILGMSELLLDTDLDNTQREYIQMVHQSGDSLLSVINDVLDFSKIEAGKLSLEPTSFDLRDKIGDTMKSLAPRAHDQGLELIFRVSRDVPTTVYGDVGRIKQLVFNLVGNAIKFTSSGEVVLSIEEASRNDDECELLFNVKDTGIGIPKNRLTSIFAEFEQVDSSTTRHFGGTGLGLAIASRIIDLMRGQIWVKSKQGEGSTFSFVIPVGVRATKSSSRPSISSLSNLKILIVDDNATNRALLKALLADWDVVPLVAENADEGLAQLKEAHTSGSPVQVVLSDVNMPENDGFKLVEWIRGDTDLVETRIILLSSSSRPGDAHMRRRLKIDAQLMKPIKSSELLRVLLRVADLVSPNRTVPKPTVEKTEEAKPDVPPLKILLAEDNIVNQRLAVGLLQKHGHTVEIASNGQEAVDQYARGSFDVILMDIQMPEVDGFEATSRIREMESRSNTHMPIVAMTAHAMKGDRERCLEAGMDQYVSKPIRIQTLLDALRDILPSTDQSQQAVIDEQPEDEPALFDHEIALQSVNGDRQLLCELIDVFTADVDLLMTDMDDAIVKDDRQLLCRAAHSIKSSLQHLGAHELAEMAISLEQINENDAIEESRNVVEKLRNMLDQLTPQLNHFKNRVIQYRQDP